MPDETLSVNELFSTIQGEGPDIGKPCLFLRLHGCGVHCPGCDTYYTWDGSEKGSRMTIEQIQLNLNLRRVQKKVGLVLSGGEPLLYYKSEGLQKILRDHWPWAGLETSGYIGSGAADTHNLRDFLSHFKTVCLSPKITPCLHGRQTDVELEKLIPTFIGYARYTNLVFKFVVKDQADIDAVLSCAQRHEFLGIFPTYLMPYGNDRDEILKSIEWLIPHAAKHGMIVTPRLHALLWGAKRGV
jgi:7-carboxy-7-deazaguanine synthase